MTEPKQIVTNTGPLIALSGIGRLDLLDALYDAVWVPEPVHDEVLQGGANGQDISAYTDANFLMTASIREQPDPILSSMLDDGEAAVIQLTRQEHISTIPANIITAYRSRGLAPTFFASPLIN